MIRYGILLATCIALAGCATAPPSTAIITRHNVVVKPSESLYRCDTTALPNPDTLTDRQIAFYIKELVRNNAECRRSLKAIHAFYESADRIIVNQSAINMVRNRKSH